MIRYNVIVDGNLSYQFCEEFFVVNVVFEVTILLEDHGCKCR